MWDGVSRVPQKRGMVAQPAHAVPDAPYGVRRNVSVGDAVDSDWLSTLYRHMEWADALVWREVLRSPAAAEDDYVQESLLHLHLVQHAYLTGWQGREPQFRDASEFPSLEALREWGKEFHGHAASFVASLDTAALTARPEVRWAEMIEQAIGQAPARIPLSDMVFQVASHSIHHRAQLNRRLRELGADPPFIDYVAWAWLGEPNADWS